MFGGCDFCLLRIEMFDQRLNAAMVKYIRCLHIFLKNDLLVFSESIPIELLKHNINYLMNHSGRYSHFQFYKHFIDFHQSKQYKPIS